MPKALSVADIHNRVEAFTDADPLVRIAAIHHAGARLRQAPSRRLREILLELLNASDPLVARYTAVTLAQSGEVQGLQHLVAAIVRARSQDEELDECLRNCRNFPFAALLNERIFLDSIGSVAKSDWQQFITSFLYGTAERFYQQ